MGSEPGDPIALQRRVPLPHFSLYAPVSLRIVAKASKNLMSTQSLGIVFGPTLLRAEKETGNMAVHMVYQNQIAELMLSEYSKIFGSEED
ncbi:CIN85-associated multi-domain containing RhoGAP 1-like protein [Camelus ferus]|nr:CIN85-associated multi-domain containing RhoGAP 1-like protein [Camelus ferus]